MDSRSVLIDFHNVPSVVFGQLFLLTILKKQKQEYIYFKEEKHCLTCLVCSYFGQQYPENKI